MKGGCNRLKCSAMECSGMEFSVDWNEVKCGMK